MAISEPEKPSINVSVQIKNVLFNRGLKILRCSVEKRDWKVSKSESVRIGKCQNEKVSESESVRIGKCQNRKVSELESFQSHVGRSPI